MKIASFTEFRQNASKYLDQVEKGEKINITRYGRPVAKLIPPGQDEDLAWKQPGVRLPLESGSLSEEIIKERSEAR